MREVAIYFFPLTISSGKEAMGPCMKFAPDLTAGELLGPGPGPRAPGPGPRSGKSNP